MPEERDQLGNACERIEDVFNARLGAVSAKLANREFDTLRSTRQEVGRYVPTVLMGLGAQLGSGTIFSGMSRRDAINSIRDTQSYLASKGLLEQDGS